jgi:PAS domain S-box-containing protein/diguanylate cyclase (GGDEF)-like protein
MSDGVAHSLPPRVPEQLLAKLRYALPQGRTLPEESWQRRHRVLLGLLFLHAVGLTIFGEVQGYDLIHALAHGGPLAAMGGLALLMRHRRRLAAGLVSLGLITSSALLVHVWGGVIEAHFHFFVMIVVLSLYEDWFPFLMAVAYVVVHHGLTGALDPHAVYNHRDAIAHPWKWAAIHGFFVTGAGIASIAAWRLNETLRAETREAYRQAYESEQRFKNAFEEAPIGMGLASIDPDHPGRLLQVNRAMCELTGYAERQLLGLSIRDITHPDDVEQSAASFRRLVEGEIPDYELEKRYVRADGRVVWGLLHVSLVRDSSGNPLYAVGQIQDVTERKAAREQLAKQALHDALTGLPNRRKLIADLESAVSRATKERPVMLLLFDLDGFKAYNDTFGHPAGDTLLARLGHRLAAAVGTRGTAYRMGGDEFCVIAPAEPEGLESLVDRAARALTEQGVAFHVTASYGSVLLPTEAVSPSQALRAADQRMYARKFFGSRASAGRQSTDVLLKVLSERSPDLGIHLDKVTDLCEEVGRKLALPEEQMTHLLQAASLHDVGKAAIPDAILSKPGSLDAQEWTFMHRHPVIGERILSAAPALAQAAKLVRSSHERMDGKGYPDGLAGDDIPLGARIIAVCDAYDAMTSDRPYRAAMSHEGALSELRKCAGTQFDHLVVEAFGAVLGERRDAAMAVQRPAG